jgi:hypothetical protein
VAGAAADSEVTRKTYLFFSVEIIDVIDDLKRIVTPPDMPAAGIGAGMLILATHFTDLILSLLLAFG